ncbi:hypothetical protein swp_3228 [Shewanella piezotolerans WP3]|uniref:Uncharacterized protein n=1 Tax=Shewanella piezotolerans (strain WP3 / JCM 13877) TaxID=225849 RepID=B8CRC6_SHEPW|nr:hypothetical protein [Shewanella piezotolerans]ACJ29934.1 hypothetical protein swp_3228 [Shewanella piezotolerans WP3]
MDTTLNSTTCSAESSQHLSMLSDKNSADVLLNKDHAELYLNQIYPNANISTITKGRMIWEALVNEEYLAIFQSCTAMMAISIDNSGSIKLEYPTEFWTVDDFGIHCPRSCFSDLRSELYNIMDWSKDPYQEQRRNACSLLSWWADEAFIREAEQLKLTHAA